MLSSGIHTRGGIYSPTMNGWESGNSWNIGHSEWKKNVKSQFKLYQLSENIRNLDDLIFQIFWELLHLCFCLAILCKKSAWEYIFCNIFMFNDGCNHGNLQIYKILLRCSFSFLILSVKMSLKFCHQESGEEWLLTREVSWSQVYFTIECYSCHTLYIKWTQVYLTNPKNQIISFLLLDQNRPHNLLSSSLFHT